MQHVRWFVTAALVAGLLAACNPEVPRTSFTYAERRGVLSSNGLRFVIMPDATTSQVEVDVRYEVGSREDPPGKAGIAHLVEHLMFQQRPDGADTAPLMQSIGSLTTFFNAYTNWDTTHYMLASRAEQLDALLKIEAMRLYFRCQTISEEEFLREREVVRNEIRQRGGTAEGRIPDLVLAEVYPKGHAYARMIGGDDANLTNITLKDACDFMDKYYTPDRATVIVAGGVDPEQATSLIQKWFGPLEKRAGAPRVEVAPVTTVSKGKAEYELDVERPVVVVAWPLPAGNTPEGRAVNFGINQFWFTTAVRAQQYEFAYSVDPIILGGQHAPVFGVAIELKGMDKLGEALEFAQKASRTAHRGIDEGSWQDLEDAKARAKASFLESLETLMARTNAIGEAVQFDQDVEFGSSDTYLIKEMSRITDFDGGFIASQVKKTLAWDKAKVIVFKPSKTGIKGDKRAKVAFQTKSHDKRDIPEVDPAEAKRPLKVAADFKAFDGAKRFELGNGMKVVLLPLDTPFPLVSAQLIFAVGDAHSGSTPGLADRAAAMLNPPIDMDASYRTGIRVGGGSTNDATIFSSGGLDIYLDVILKSMERTVYAGTYDQRGVEGWQKALRERMQRKDYQQNMEFQRQIATALFGADHPYTLNAVYSPDSIGAISQDRLAAFRGEHYTAGNATLIVAGKFDLARAEALVRSTFGGWSRGRVDQPIGPEVRARTAPEFIGVVGNEGPQMKVAIAYPAPAGIDGQEAARRVLTEMINLRMGDIRFKLGSTYGVYAGRQTQIGPGAYQMGGDVDAPRAGESLKAMRDGLERLRQGVDFDVDFVRARRSLIEDLLGQSTVSSQMAARLGLMARFALPADYYEQLIKQIAAVSPAQVKMLLAKELDPAKEIVVCLADRPTLERAFREAGLDQVKIVEPNYR
ncbi:MAG TPA: pitrilysin family protein [Kofleriaceae bacterium]|nr:pitrilysin family protein [Kofleriaceae bacterium]